VKLRLKKLLQFSGNKASFYTILVDGKAKFRDFLIENEKKYEQEILQMMARFVAMGNKTGATDNFFKLEESANPDDEKVVCYYDIPDKNLRLFCIKMSDKLIVLIDGGPKPRYHIKWQHNPKLKKEGELTMIVSETIDKRIAQGLLDISCDELDFTGNLELN
jgi:hypothetical protein